MPKLNFTEASVETILNTVGMIETILASAKRSAELMREHDIGSVELTSYSSLQLGMKKLESWSNGVVSGVRVAMHDKGCFTRGRPPELHVRIDPNKNRIKPG